MRALDIEGRAYRCIVLSDWYTLSSVLRVDGKDMTLATLPS